MAVTDDELDQDGRRPWWARLWNLVRSDWPATSLAVIAMVVAAVLAQQVRNTYHLRNVVDDLRQHQVRAAAQSCKDRNDARDALRTVLQGIIQDPATSEGGRQLLLAQLAKVQLLDCRALGAGDDPAEASTTTSAP